MKKIISCAALLLLVMASTGFCWVQSFRSAATGDLLLGDFDNDLDPIFVLRNDGSRLYTAFSNLTSSNDRFFSNASNGIYLFGASGTIPFLKSPDWKSRTMFLVQLADSRLDANSGLDTDYNGLVDLPGTGYMAADYVQYLEINGDNIFDTRLDIGSTADNYDKVDRRDWHLTHSYGVGDVKFGLAFSHLGFGSNATENNRSRGLFTRVIPARPYTYSQDLTQTDLSTQAVVETRRERGDFLTKYQTPADIAEASLEFPLYIFSEADLRFNLVYADLRDKYAVDDRYEFSRDVSAGGITDVNSRSESVGVDSSLDGSAFIPGLLYTTYWSEQVYSWFGFDLTLGKFDADRSFSNLYASQSRLSGPTGNVGGTERDDVIRDVRNGETDRTAFRVYHKTEAAFSERFIFAAGFDIYRQKDNTAWDQDYALDYAGSFDNGDAIPDRGDSTFSIASSYAATLDNDVLTTAINLPVAMEYALGKWSFRLGAIHTIVNTTEDLNRRITDSTPPVTRIYYGDGDSSVVVGDDQQLSNRTSHHNRSFGNLFVYGLGFRATDNLNAELLAFLGNQGVDFINTDFFRGLRLSLTVSF